MRLIVLFSLKPGVSHESYQQWARTHDIPTVRNLPSIAGFDVYRATGRLGGGPVPYDYIEIIDIADMDVFNKDIATEKMQTIAGQFSEIADAIFLTTEPVA